MAFWNTLKNVGQKIGSFITKGANKVSKFATGASNLVDKARDFTQKIPVVGEVAAPLLDMAGGVAQNVRSGAELVGGLSGLGKASSLGDVVNRLVGTGKKIIGLGQDSAQLMKTGSASVGKAVEKARKKF